MKTYRGKSERLISYEYTKASQRLERTNRVTHTKPTISIRSITPEGLLSKCKETRKNQASFSYVPKTKTPGVRPKAKMGSGYKYFKAERGNKSTDIISKSARDSKQTSTKTLGIKFSSRNSKQNTNTDTLCSLKSTKSKKGQNVYSNTSEREKMYQERCKMLKNENKKLRELLEENNSTISSKVKENKKELELLSKLLFEVLPMLKNQIKLEEYSSRDFRVIEQQEGTSKKREILQKLLTSITESKKEPGWCGTQSSLFMR